MNIQVKINDRVRNVRIIPSGSRTEFSLDGKGVNASVVELEQDLFSVILGGEAFEVRISAALGGARILIEGSEYHAELDDPRQWRHGASTTPGAEGRQKVAAPMPGKVVRILVKNGEKVASGQGLLIVEAMKMQNEVKSPKDGAVERINVAEGQPVNAGEILAVIA